MKHTRNFSIFLIGSTLLFIAFFMFFLNQINNTSKEPFLTKETPLSSLQINTAIPTFSFPTPPPTQTLAPSELGGLLLCESRVTNDPGSDIFLINLDSQIIKQLTHTVNNGRPKWSPDGNQIAFVSDRDGNSNIYIMNSDGTSQQRLTDYSGYDSQFDWSPSGKEIVFVSDRDGNSEIYKIDIHTKEITRLTVESSSDGEPTWSSDGNKIAFVSSRVLGSAVFIMDTDGKNVRQITEANVGYARPIWCPDDSCLIIEEGGGSWYNKTELISLNLETSEQQLLLQEHPILKVDAIAWYASVSVIKRYIVFWLLGDNKSLMYAFDMRNNELYSLGVQGCIGDLFP